jgi:ribosome-binding ATPase YchF (GTP1/OBG family)
MSFVYPRIPEQYGFYRVLFSRVNHHIGDVFSLLGRISFFTVGEDEVKAWVIPVETKAPKAACAWKEKNISSRTVTSSTSASMSGINCS